MGKILRLDFSRDSLALITILFSNLYRSSDKVESPGTLHGTDFLKTMENFICRAKGLEADFIR